MRVEEGEGGERGTEPGSGDGTCKGPEAGVCLLCLRSSKVAVYLERSEGRGTVDRRWSCG